MLSDSDIEDDEGIQNICSSSVLNSDDNHNSKTNSFKDDDYTKSKNLSGLTQCSNNGKPTNKKSYNSKIKPFRQSFQASNIAPGLEENGILYGNISPPRDAMNEYFLENMRNLEPGSYFLPSSGHSLDTNSSGLHSYCNGYSMMPLNDDQLMISSDEENQVLVWQAEDRKMENNLLNNFQRLPNQNGHNDIPLPANQNNLLTNQVSEDFIDIDMVPQSYMTQSDIEAEEELMLQKFDSKRHSQLHECSGIHNDLSDSNKKPIMNDFWNNLNRRLSNDSAGSSTQFDARGDCSPPGNCNYDCPTVSNDLTKQFFISGDLKYLSNPFRSLRDQNLLYQEDEEDADSESSDTVPPGRENCDQRELLTLHRSSAILSDISNDPLHTAQARRILNNHQNNSSSHFHNVYQMINSLRISEVSRATAAGPPDESYSLSPSVRNRYHLSGLNRLTPCASTGHLLDLEVTCNQTSMILKESDSSKCHNKIHSADKTVRPANSVDQLTENFPKATRSQTTDTSATSTGGGVVKPLYVSSCLAESDQFQWSYGLSIKASNDGSSAMIWSDLQATLSQRAQRLPSSHASVAVMNMLRALKLSHHAVIPSLISSLTARQNVARSESSGRVQGQSDLSQYLINRSQQGISGHRLVSMANQTLTDLVVGRFFQTNSDLNISVTGFLMRWIRMGAVPILTINTQMGVPEMYIVPDTGWQHQMVYGVRQDGICLSNPNQTVPESLIQHQLNSSSTLLIRQSDVLANWSSSCDITQLCRQSDPRWNLMNVLGQVVCTIRESQHENFPGFKPEWAHHIRVPCIYKPGISLFVAANNRKAVNQLLSAPELTSVNSENISINYESDHSSSQFSASLLPPQSSPSESTDSSSNSASSAVSSLHLSASRPQQQSLQPLLNVPINIHNAAVGDELRDTSTVSSDFLVHGLETESSLTTAPSTSLSMMESRTDLPFNFLTRSVSHATPSSARMTISSGTCGSTVSYSCPTTSSSSVIAQSDSSFRISTASSIAEDDESVSHNPRANGLPHAAIDSDSEEIAPLNQSDSSRHISDVSNVHSVTSVNVSRSDSTNRSHGSSTVALPR